MTAAPWSDGTARFALTLPGPSGSFRAMSEDLKARLRDDLIVARKARNRLNTVVLSTLLSEVRNREIEVGGELDDEGVQSVVVKAIKQRRDAATQMLEGGRPELAEKESKEASILQVYLPPALSEADVQAIVREAIEAGATEMGQIMPKIQGRFDGKEANRIVREELA